MKVTKIDKRDALEITIDGEQYRTLAKIAAALDTVESGHTPESVCREFLMGAPVEMLSRPSELADFIVGDARFDGEEREAAIKSAFARAGLWGQSAETVANA